MERSPIFLISVSFSFWHLNLAPWPFRESPEVYGSPSSLASSTAILTISMQHSTHTHNATQWHRRYLETGSSLHCWWYPHHTPRRSTHIGNMPTISRCHHPKQRWKSEELPSNTEVGPSNPHLGLGLPLPVALNLLSQSQTSHGFFCPNTLIENLAEAPNRMVLPMARHQRK